MKRPGTLLFRQLTAALMAAGLLTACARADEETQRKIDQLQLKVESIEKKVGTMPAGGGPIAGQPGQPRAGQPPGQPQQRPPGPDLAAVYSVDIKGDAWEGAEHAKVTVVEAFEFA